MTNAVLITRVDGSIDYCTFGEVQVVYVDLDRHDLDRAFPDDLTADIAAVLSLPPVPWRDATVAQLRKLQARITDSIRNEAPPTEEVP